MALTATWAVTEPCWADTGLNLTRKIWEGQGNSTSPHCLPSAPEDLLGLWWSFPRGWGVHAGRERVEGEMGRFPLTSTQSPGAEVGTEDEKGGGFYQAPRKVELRVRSPPSFPCAAQGSNPGIKKDPGSKENKENDS